MQEQIAQRKHDEAAKKKAALEDLKKKEDALKALELMFKSNVAIFKKELDSANRKSSEERAKQSKVERKAQYNSN